MRSFGYIHENYNVIELRLFQSYFHERAQLQYLPDSIGNLIELHTLDVSHNQLQELPATLPQLEGLENFYLDYNQFSTVPAEIFHLEHLQQLNFDENLLTTIPSGIVNSPYLQSLHLAGNLLTEFPAELSALRYLKRLVLNRNLISTLDYMIMNEFLHLYVLDLRANKIPQEQIAKAQAFLRLSGVKRRKYYFQDYLNDYENPFSIHNIGKRIRSDPLLQINPEDDVKVEELALRIKSNHDNRYEISGRDEVLN